VSTRAQGAQEATKLPLSLHSARTQLVASILTLEHPSFASPVPLPSDLPALEGGASEGDARAGRDDGPRGCVLRQVGATISGDGEEHVHELAIELDDLSGGVGVAGPGGDARVAEAGRAMRDGNGGSEGRLGWDCKATCLRTLPVRVHVRPDCHLDSEMVMLVSSEVRQLPLGAWLGHVVDGVARHLCCLDFVAREVRALIETHSGLLSATISQASSHMVCVCARARVRVCLASACSLSEFCVGGLEVDPLHPKKHWWAVVLCCGMAAQWCPLRAARAWQCR
jgi:hypothetical protein